MCIHRAEQRQGARREAESFVVFDDLELLPVIIASALGQAGSPPRAVAACPTCGGAGR